MLASRPNQETRGPPWRRLPGCGSPGTPAQDWVVALPDLRLRGGAFRIAEGPVGHALSGSEYLSLTLVMLCVIIVNSGSVQG